MRPPGCDADLHASQQYELHTHAGFHFYRKQLDAMPDPAEAHARRGAHWTFDAHRFLQAVIAVRKAGDAAAARHM